MAEVEQDSIATLARLVRMVTATLERVIASNGDDEPGEREPCLVYLFGSKKSYCDVLIDLSEISLKLEAVLSRRAHFASNLGASQASISDQDVSIVKQYIERQRALAKAALDQGA